MKFTCSKENLLNAVNIVSKACNPSSPVLILGGIYFKAYDRLLINSTNMEISIECEVDADIIEQGEILIDARIISDILRKTTEDNINFEVNSKNEVFVYTHNNKYNIMGMSASDFPKFEDIMAERYISIPSKDFKDAVRSTTFASAMDESNPILTGINFEVTKQEMKLVAIDGFRMAIRKIAIPEREDEFNFIVKGKILNELLKILKDDDTTVDISFNENNALFAFDNCKIKVSLMSGEYIKYNQFIPKNNEISIKLDRRIFTQMVERASIIINYDDIRIPVVIEIEGDSLSISCTSKTGNFHEEFAIYQTATELKIGLGSKYLLDVLKSIDEDNIVISFTSAETPCVITPVDGDSFYYMILPRILK